MRKRTIIILILMTMLLLVSCDIIKDKEKNVNETTEQVEKKEYKTNSEVDYLNKKILVIYFSSANLNDVDAVSSATAIGDGDGATGTFAKYIHDRVGGDIAKIVPEEDYPLDFDQLKDIATKEKEARMYPKFLTDVNPEAYDIVFVGYPIWYYDMPRVMYTFFARYDFDGKTVIPFNTYGSSHDGGTYDKIRELEPDADVVEGLAIEGKSVDTSKNFVEQWVPEL